YTHTYPSKWLAQTFSLPKAIRHHQSQRSARNAGTLLLHQLPSLPFLVVVSFADRHHLPTLPRAILNHSSRHAPQVQVPTSDHSPLAQDLPLHVHPLPSPASLATAASACQRLPR